MSLADLPQLAQPHYVELLLMEVSGPKLRNRKEIANESILVYEIMTDHLQAAYVQVVVLC